MIYIYIYKVEIHEQQRMVKDLGKATKRTKFEDCSRTSMARVNDFPFVGKCSVGREGVQIPRESNDVS